MEIAGRYLLWELIGAGSFGQVYKALDIYEHVDVAVKLEPCDFRVNQLENEEEVYDALKYAEGFPAMHGFGTTDEVHYLVMDLLGPSLEMLFHFCGKRFTLGTVLRIALQAVDRLESLHVRGYVHRDLKPANFLVGVGGQTSLLYLIDLGLAVPYLDIVTRAHIKYNDEHEAIGTPLFSSINIHHGIAHSRRDDLIALAYILLFFVRGSLPWQGIPGSAKTKRNDQLVRAKAKAKPSQLCKGLPTPFCVFVEYVMRLKFDERPNYLYIRNLLRQCRSGVPNAGENTYDWEQRPEDRGVRV
ncbi:casein kinase I isoform alpha-like protein [Fomitopsis serialis]|uniref:casein kinase I isoform alpha-like protein n=1 Tax=Fomitopsis serialis TaxID=139415 RepID=UPI00200815C0|nr:casein kinase I isoform alpha-like protein [Neoantrodia serialis]KAH9911420.1 casein kinase I isoform alpha-like protein [Neoantrodia serialis]